MTDKVCPRVLCAWFESLDVGMASACAYFAFSSVQPKLNFAHHTPTPPYATNAFLLQNQTRIYFSLRGFPAAVGRCYFMVVGYRKASLALVWGLQLPLNAASSHSTDAPDLLFY